MICDAKIKEGFFCVHTVHFYCLIFIIVPKNVHTHTVQIIVI